MKLPIFQLNIIDVNLQAEFIQNFFSDITNEKNKNSLESLGINIELYKTNNHIEQLNLIKKCVKDSLEINLEKINNMIFNIDKKIKSNYDLIINEFGKIFCIEYSSKQIYNINIGICNVCPRYLSEYSFNINTFDSISENFETILHEMTHFYWFDKLNKLYPNINVAEYEYPHFIWLISEIVVDAILNNSAFKKFLVSPPSYEYFYTIKVNGVPLIEYFNEMFNQSKNIEDYIKRTMKFIANNSKFLKTLL